jgi:RNA:NAD 2'-phosphotransferase (TPT1/KptA family)
MSQALRSDAILMGLVPCLANEEGSRDAQGNVYSSYFRVSDILKHPRVTCNGVTREFIEREVESNAKTRIFSHPRNANAIAAWNGHRMTYRGEKLQGPVASTAPRNTPLVLCHGTYMAYKDSILERGIFSIPDDHTAVHLMDPEDIRSAGLWRQDLDTIVDVAANDFAKSGGTFKQCGNRVWLQEKYIPPAFNLGVRSKDSSLPQYPRILEWALDAGITPEIAEAVPEPVAAGHLALPSPGTITAEVRPSDASGGSSRPPEKTSIGFRSGRWG